MNFLQIGVYDDDIPVLCYIVEQWEAERKVIYYAVLGCQETRCVFATGLFTGDCKQTHLGTKIVAIYSAFP